MLACRPPGRQAANQLAICGTPLAGAPAPAAAGTQQCATIATTASFVGLRAIDPAGNISYPAAVRVKTKFPKA